MSYSASDVTRIASTIQHLEKEINSVILGQASVVRHLLVAVLAGGHALLEGVPGLAKTMLIRTLAKAIKVDFKRIQFTPDLMPADVTGAEILAQHAQSGQHRLEFRPGPLFTNILLADEINRTPPKTQSALLEAMQEHAVTIAGLTRPLPEPFFVLATQNPIEQAGTYPLPEAQLDRFLLYITIDYPQEQDELEVLRQTTGNKQSEVQQVASAEELLLAQTMVRDVTLAPELFTRINRIIRGTRPLQGGIPIVNQHVKWGAGPRAGQALVLAAKAHAFINGRFAVLPEDVSVMAPAVLRHRILPSLKARSQGITPDAIIAQLVSEIP